MFRMLVHPSSGACDLFVELFHVLYCYLRIEVFSICVLVYWRVISRDVCGCFNKRVSVNIGFCGVLWFLSSLVCGVFFYNVS